MNLAARGETLWANLGCSGCPTNAGDGVGPSLIGLYGTDRSLVDGSNVMTDEAYLRESILNPATKVVDGYPQVMPSYEGRIRSGRANEIGFVLPERAVSGILKVWTSSSAQQN